MYIGPIHPTLPFSGAGHNPIKPIRVVMNGSSVSQAYQGYLFDNTYPLAVQKDIQNIEATTAAFSSTVNGALALIHQIEELASNAEWQRCGMYIQWRDDGVQDGEDGWYTFNQVDISEDTIFSGYSEPKISVDLRQRFIPYLGSFIDSKAQPNFKGLSGTTLGAYPGGLDTSNLNPKSTWSYSASDGSTIFVVEGPPNQIQAPLTAPLQTMTMARCAVYDTTLDDTTSTEVFWKDHRYINGYVKITNGLLRYTVQIASNVAPIIEVWNGSAWVTMGYYQLDGGVSGVQRIKMITVSPEEVVWEEQRWSTASSSDQGRYVVTNRVRRGSRIIESQVLCASNGHATTPVGACYLSNMPASVNGFIITSDGTAVIGTGGTGVVPGFLYLDQPSTGSGLISNFNGITGMLGGGNSMLGNIVLGSGGQGGSVSSTDLDSGYSIVQGTVTRFGILCGYQDAQWTSLGGTAQAYGTRFSAYNRNRVRQRMLLSG